MSLLRDREQSTLIDLNAFGAGLLQRYEQLLEAELDDRLSGALRRLLARRRPLLDALREREAARGDPPKAADVELNQFRAAADRLLGALFGPQVPARRVVQTEAAWRDRLQAARDIDWSAKERELIEALTEEAATAKHELRAFEEPQS